MNLKLFSREINLRKEIIAVLLVLFAAVAGVTGYFINRSGESIIIEKPVKEALTVGNTITGTSKGTETGTAPQQEELQKPEEDIKVYILGCVKNQGVVTLKKGQMIDDAIKAAGGPTEDADLENVNLVYKLNENVMVKIKSKKDTQLVKTNSNASTGGSGNKVIEAGASAVIIKDSGGVIVDEGTSQNGVKGKVNINTALVDELDTLPGVGQQVAQDIIAYREKHGEFKAITDIMKVPGIKESKFSRIKDYITVN